MEHVLPHVRARRALPPLAVLTLLAAAFLLLPAFAGTAAAAPVSTDNGTGFVIPDERGDMPLPTPPNVTVPTAPAAPAVPGADGTEDGKLNIEIGGKGGGMSSPLAIVVILGVVSLVPAMLIMMTAFTRIVIVLGFTRSALNTTGIPPNQVIIGLALFLTMFVMAPQLSEVNDRALQPYLDDKIELSVAYDRAMDPMRDFMCNQVRDADLEMFVDLSKQDKDEIGDCDDVNTSTLIPAYVISELRTAFLIGFIIFIPFIIIDLVVSAALSAMGMMMVPPVLISLPFKLLLFVAADGWSLVVESLVKSFQVA